MIKIILAGLSAFFILLLKIPLGIAAFKSHMDERKRAKMTRRLKELETEKQQDESKKRLEEEAKSASKADIYKHFGSSKF